MGDEREMRVIERTILLVYTLVSKTPHTLFRGIGIGSLIFMTRSKILKSCTLHFISSEPRRGDTPWENFVTFLISLTQTSIAERSIELAVSNFVRVRRDRLEVQCFKPGLIWQSRSSVIACFVTTVQLQDLLFFYGQTFEDRNFKLCHDL